MSHRRRRTRDGTRGGGLPPGPVPPASRPPARRATGFTLVELLVVMVIISILLGFILNAALASVKRAQERATQALITKLESGLNDRLDALMQTRPDPNSAHNAIGAIWNSSSTLPIAGHQRAQAIAWYDYIKRYMPDTFYIQNTSPTAAKGVYPINFAANPYPVSGGSTTDPAGLGLYILPMGNSVAAIYGDGSGTGYSLTSNTGLMQYNPTGDGIYGAAYSVAAGIYKNLGYQPIGFDGIDNNADGAVDDALEGLNSSNQSQVATNLGNHTHVTARAEMLYALLVEGQGPLGSVFARDDFTDREVQDTDGDGLPEFVDAWGNPLQFFRWPILYHSDIQRGQQFLPGSASVWTLTPPYASMYEQREQDPLDLNQQLVAPAWWSSGYNNNSFTQYSLPDSGLGLSGGAQAFEYYFHRLTDPYPNPDPSGTFTNQNYWDRGSTYGSRRAFYSKFLILSAGLDGQIRGLPLLRHGAERRQQSGLGADRQREQRHALQCHRHDFGRVYRGLHLGRDVRQHNNLVHRDVRPDDPIDRGPDPVCWGRYQQPEHAGVRGDRRWRMRVRGGPLSVVRCPLPEHRAGRAQLDASRPGRYRRDPLANDGPRTTDHGPRTKGPRRGFTLIELLVVILIVLLVSAVALPTVLPALSHREVSEAARILQGTLVGARDKAIHDGQPSGIRLLPDPAFPITWTSTGAINAYSILAYNRIVPISPAPDYQEGMVTPITAGTISALGNALSIPGAVTSFLPGAMVLIETPVNPSTGAPYSPTSWFWNVRVGDKVQIDGAGPWYTVVGPMANGASAGNTELFVNVGAPAALGTYANGLPSITVGNTAYPAEFLLLVNGKDDNQNGWTDEGFDGVDNDGDGLVDETTCTLSTAGEWEAEGWAAGVLYTTQIGVPYTIQRRPAPAPAAREIALPTSMVVDATTLFNNKERSRLPINIQTQYSGLIDIVLNPDGTVVPTTTYSSPSSFGMDQAFYHFWLAERQDLVPVQVGANGAIPLNSGTPSYYLPIAQPGGSAPSSFPGPYLKGEYSVLSLASRTGQIAVSHNPPFFYDPALGYTNQPTSNSVYNPVYPFIQAEQGANWGP